MILRERETERDHEIRRKVHRKLVVKDPVWGDTRMTSLGREQVAAQRGEKGSTRNYGSLGVKVQPVSCVVNVKKTCCVLAYRRIDDKRTSYKENMG